MSPRASSSSPLRRYLSILVAVVVALTVMTAAEQPG